MRYKNNRYYGLWVVGLLMGFICVGLCGANRGPTAAPPVPETAQQVAEKTKGAVETAEAGATVRAVCERITAGDFATADNIIKSSSLPVGGRLGQLREIIDEHTALEAARAQARNTAYTEQIDKLEELRVEIKMDHIFDVNDISDAFTVIIKAMECGGEEKKQKLKEDAFVKQVVEKTLEKARLLEEENKWTDAYAYCYYWLINFDEDNKDYEEHADELSDKAMIELFLKDDSCGQTGEERQEGIKAEMFILAMRVLDTSYVSVIDYNEMTVKALDRCQLLMEVVTALAGELDYQPEPDKVEMFNAGLGAIRKGLDEPAKAFTNDRFISVFGDLMALNLVTVAIPREIIVAQFTEAAFASLDPYTNLIWPWQIKDFQKNITQQFIGIGVEISKASGVLKVVSLLPDTPAYTSGLDADDTILAVNGEPTDDMTITCAVSKITGPRNTKVTLTIKHAYSEQSEDITIVRDRIVVPPVRGWQRTDDGKWQHVIDPKNNVGYIHVTSFAETTVQDMEKTLRELESKGLNGLILDLRGNSGGYLTSAAEMVDMFVEDGPIVSSKPRWGVSTRKDAHKRGTHPNYPLVVLIDGSSASASEIVAGALQDDRFKRATLVGSRSYGKGSVQVVTSYTGDDSQLKYTMAYYHLPSGQPVANRYVMEKLGREDWGIMPDVEVELMMNERKKLIDVKRANDVLAKANHDNGSSPLTRHSIQETLDSDPQLAMALLVMKSKLVQANKYVTQTGRLVSLKKSESRSQNKVSAGKLKTKE